MSISDAVAPHIAFLRRFARALSGTQAAGDAYVAATLEAILAGPDCLDAELDPKVALYKLFLRGWRNVPTNNHVDIRTFGDEASANTSGFVYYVAITGITGSAAANSRTQSARLLRASSGTPNCRSVPVSVSAPRKRRVRSPKAPMAPWSAPRWSMP